MRQAVPAANRRPDRPGHLRPARSGLPTAGRVYLRAAGKVAAPQQEHRLGRGIDVAG